MDLKKRDVGNLVSVPAFVTIFGNNYYFTTFFLPNAMIAPRAASIATARAAIGAVSPVFVVAAVVVLPLFWIFIVIFAIVVFLCIRISDRICYKMLLDHFTLCTIFDGEYICDSGFFEKLSCFCSTSCTTVAKNINCFSFKICFVSSYIFCKCFCKIIRKFVIFVKK